MLLTAAAPAAFYWIVSVLGAYLIVGIIAAVALHVLGNGGLGAFDPHARRSDAGRPGIGFRVLVFPGIVALWPFVLIRRLRSGSDARRDFLERRRREPRPLISGRHRIYVGLLLIFLPPFYALALLLGRSDGPPVDASTLETAAAAATGVPLARARVSTELRNDFVPRLELEVLVVREEAAKLFLYTRPGLDLLPPDTLLYWSPPNTNGNAGDEANGDSGETNAAGDAEDAGGAGLLASAYLLGALPAGPGRLPFPGSTAEGRILGYSLAHQQILFRTDLVPVTATQNKSDDPSGDAQ